MEIIENTIRFKSIPMFFEKEKYGLKPNTVRELSGAEWDLLLNNITHLDKIWITSTEDETEFFTRTITDISFFDNRFIFSWEPAGF